MGLTRVTHSPTSIHRNVIASRIRRRDATQSRTIWWWGKNSQGWRQNSQDDIEESIRRHQALMMHRYSKAIRRRSLWERENSPRYSGWRLRGSGWEREMSSSESRSAKVEDRDVQNKNDKQAWQVFHNDFESFKKAVDRAIARDPYGTLFGRRLRSPDTPNNSAWTSWSWIFNPKEIKEEPIPEPSKDSKKSTATVKPENVLPTEQSATASKASEQPGPAVVHSSSSSKTSTSMKFSQSMSLDDSASITTDYIYDPISGRKIPKSDSAPQQTGPKMSPTPETESTTPSGAEHPSLVTSLFTEHGADIPVKTYKPHKVYGYTGESKPKVTESMKTELSPKKNFENSRKREYNQFLLRTLGNNIDATNFPPEIGVKKEDEPAPDQQPVEKRTRMSPAPSEDTPLFSGTTYHTRVDGKTAQTTQPSDWLAQEGFREKQGMTLPSLKSQTSPAGAHPQPNEKIEPAIDRKPISGTEIPVKKFGSKLQPALDRVVPPSIKDDAPPKAISMPAPPARLIETPEEDRREDLDLLRASDVRAAAKASRLTKQAVDDKKKEDRTKLEQDFTQRQQAEESPSVKGSLSNVWKHIKNYPQGIVAKTVQSLGLTDSNTAATSKNQKLEVPTGAELRNVERRITPPFSEPTVKPGVVRDLALEKHTQQFEPKLATIVDKAKSVKRELHDVSLGIGDVVNHRAIAAMANRDMIIKQDPLTSITTITAAESPKPVEPKPIAEEIRAPAGNPASNPISTPVDYQSAFILLMYNPTIGEVEMTPLNNLMGHQPAPEAKTNAMAAIGSLKNPNAFVKHFVDLDKNGYQLTSGSSDMLMFQKRQPVATSHQSQPITPSLPSTLELRNTIVAAEAAAPPEPSSFDRRKTETKKAATVLDELPPTIPPPGPSAPSAPSSTSTRPSGTKPSPSSSTPETVVPLSSISTPQSSTSSTIPPATQTIDSERLKPRKSCSRISRTEEVFSGRPLPTQTTTLPDPNHFQKQTPLSSPSTSATSYQQQQKPSSSTSEPRPGFFARVRRAIRRTLLTALAFGAGAYGIGVVAEGLSKHAQIEGGERAGPMKRLVMDGEKQREGKARQRSGIYSTESSR